MKFLNKLWDLYERLVRFVVSRVFKLFKRELSEEKMDKLVEFAKFCLVGLSNTFISLACYYIIVLINEDLYIVGNFVGFFVSVLNSFFWNSHFVFKKTDEKGKTLVKTLLSYGFSLLLGTGLLYIMVDVMHISALLAPIINIIITTPINYVINKLWAYKQG